MQGVCVCVCVCVCVWCVQLCSPGAASQSNLKMKHLGLLISAKIFQNISPPPGWLGVLYTQRTLSHPIIL